MHREAGGDVVMYGRGPTVGEVCALENVWRQCVRGCIDKHIEELACSLEAITLLPEDLWRLILSMNESRPPLVNQAKFQQETSHFKVFLIM
tara:strand:- start:922 stop:1194 length:273 start_codon:yes stop_codon:yes gene_type:complete